jgi:hypothetical protein
MRQHLREDRWGIREIEHDRAATGIGKTATGVVVLANFQNCHGVGFRVPAPPSHCRIVASRLGKRRNTPPPKLRQIAETFAVIVDDGFKLGGRE